MSILEGVCVAPLFVALSVAGSNPHGNDRLLQVPEASTPDSLLFDSDTASQAKGVLAIIQRRAENPGYGLARCQTNKERHRQCVSILLDALYNAKGMDREDFKKAGIFRLFSAESPADEANQFLRLWLMFPYGRDLLGDKIEDLSKNSSEKQRLMAVVALQYGICGSATTKRILIHLAADPSWKVRSEAGRVAVSLGHHGVLETDAVSQCLGVMFHAEFGMRARKSVIYVFSSAPELECASALRLRKDFVHSLVEEARRADRPSKEYLVACSWAACYASTAPDDAATILRLMRRTDIPGHDYRTVIGLLRYITKKQASANLVLFSKSESDSGSVAYYKSAARGAVQSGVDRKVVDSLVRWIEQGDVGTTGYVLGKHNPEMLSTIIQEVDRNANSLEILVAQTPTSLVRTKRALFAKLMESASASLRVHAATAVLRSVSYGTDARTAARILNDAVVDGRMHVGVRLSALRTLVDHDRLETVRGKTLTSLMDTSEQGVPMLGGCELRILSVLLDEIGSGHGMDEDAAHAILAGLEHVDISPCYTLIKAQLRTAPRLADQLGKATVRKTLERVRATAESNEVRDLATQMLRKICM